MALKPQVKLTQDRSTNADKNQTVLGFEVSGINMRTSSSSLDLLLHGR
jgi:hypothetical protein